MNINAPENVEPKEPEIVADQATPPDATPAAVSLSSISDRHTESHPGFDPAIHAVNADGTPKKKADGTFAMKRGRKAGNPLPPKDSATGAQKDTSSGDMTESVTPVTPRITPDEAARQSANLVINGCVLLCGEKIGAPVSKEEGEGLLFSFKNYYEVRGVPNIPPEIGLAIGVGLYVYPRVRESESAKGKIARAIEWVKARIGA